MKYRECPNCGAALDPGERCDCQNNERGRPAGTGTTSNKGDTIRSLSAQCLEVKPQTVKQTYKGGYHMKIKSLRLENFQGIEHAEFDFDGLSASIYGDNATGKTTVFNAVTWLLFDKASTGAKNFTPKTKGAAGDIHNLDHAAEAAFIMPSGEIATFRKVYHEVYKKKRGSSKEEFDGNTVDFFIDGVPVKEKQYTGTLQNYCGGIERMKMLTMPDYFAEVMPWDERRKILLELCGDITDEDVIRSSEDLAEIDSYLRKPGTGNQFYSVEEYKKIADARKREISKQLLTLPGRINEACRAIPDQSISVSGLSAKIDRCSQIRADLMEQRAALRTGSTAVAEARRKTAEAEAALAHARSAYSQRASEANTETMEQIAKATETLAEARSRASTAKGNAERFRAQAKSMEDSRNRLLRDYAQEQARVWDETQENCPYCGQRLPPERVSTMKAEFNQRRSDRLMEINRMGKEKCSKDAIADSTRKAEEAEAAAVGAEREAVLIQQKIDGLKTMLSQPPAFESTPEYIQLSGEIMVCRAAEREAAQAGAPDTSTLDSQLKTVEMELEDLQRKKAQVEQAEAQKNRIAELEAQEKQMGAEYENLERGVWLCDEFTKAKVRMLTSRIDSKFSSVRFRLFQEQLNGGVKDDCEVLIPGDGGRMVPYSFANNAARINAGLEIIGVLADHWDMEMPVFIDNAESVTHLARTWTQTIRLVVSEQDKKLRLAIE